MMARPIVVIGAGGFGRDMHDVIEALNAVGGDPDWEFLGFVDDGEPDSELITAGGRPIWAVRRSCRR